MTTPSLSWIDRSRWSALLENATPTPASGGRARAPLPAKKPAAQPAPAPAPAPAAVAPEPAPEPTPAPVSAAPVSQVLPLSFEPPHAELEERLQAFFEWVIRSVPCSAAFIADEHGLPLIQRGAMPDHIAFSSSVLALLESLEGLPKRWLSIGIARDTILHLAEVTTVWGRFGVGIVAGDSLRRDVLAIVQQGLERAFEE